MVNYLTSPPMRLLLLLRRLLGTALALVLLASVVFLLSHRQPGSGPEEQLLPERGDLSGTVAGTAASRARAGQQLRHRLGLDLPLFYVGRKAKGWRWHGTRNQYHRWLGSLLRGDLGVSLRSGQPVAALLVSALAYTLPLMAAALGLVVLAALLLGQQLAALKQWWHAPVRSALVSLHSIPLFVVALGLLLLFANPEVLDWFPVYSNLGEETPLGWARLGAGAARLVLPVISLVLVALPDLTLQLEAALRQELRADYATTARAKGLGEGQVIRRHALANALLPTITQVTELLPVLVSGALVVEVVYALPGMGRLLAEAATRYDYPVLIGGVLLVGTARLLTLLLADGLYSWADPRIKWLA